MKLALIVAGFCFVNLINGFNCETENGKIFANIEKAVEVITKTTDALNSSLDKFSEFFEKATEVAKKFSGFLQELNKMVKIGMDIVNMIKGETEEDPLDKLKSYIGEQFAIVNGKLELIENKIDQVNLVFQDELAKSKLRDYLHRRDNIREMLASFSKNPNNITTHQLKKVCADNSMRGFINFLTVQVMDGGEGSLLAAMKRGNVRKTFFQWTKNIYGMFVEANVLYTQCFTATYFKEYSEEEFNITLKMDTEKFEEMLTKVTQKLENEHNEFLKPKIYMKWVYDELRENMKRHRGMGNEEFSIYMKNFLAEKYDWRSWIVGSYAGDTITSDQHLHSMTDTTLQVFREENRCVYIVSMKKLVNDAGKTNEMHDWGRTISNFVQWEGPHKTLSKDKCKNMYEIIAAKFPDVIIDCVKMDKDIKVSHSPGAMFTTIVVTTYDDSGKTRTFPNQYECDKWVHLNRFGPYPGGLVFTPEHCWHSSMMVVIAKLSNM